MGFPTQIPHRRNRRKLGRGQFPAVPTIGVTVTSTGGTNATLTFNRPINLTGTVGLTVAGRTFVSQTRVSPTIVTQAFDGAVTGNAYALQAGDPAISDQYGGRLAGTGGTFP